MDPKNRNAWVRAGLAAVVLHAPASLRASSPASSPKLDRSHFKLVWQDEFAGNHLEPSRWQAPAMVRQGHSRWVPSLVSVRDGMLQRELPLRPHTGLLLGVPLERLWEEP